MDRYVLLYYLLRTNLSLSDSLASSEFSNERAFEIFKKELLKVVIESSSLSRVEILSQANLMSLDVFGLPIVPYEVINREKQNEQTKID